MQHHKELDASGLTCPLPIIRTKKAMLGLRPGEVLRMVSTDPRAPQDIARLMAQSGDSVLRQLSENGKFVSYLRKT